MRAPKRRERERIPEVLAVAHQATAVLAIDESNIIRAIRALFRRKKDDQ